VHSFLGSHVSQTNRTKIVSGQYIDLAILSENTNSENNDKQVVLIDGVLSTKEKIKRTIHTIEKWTDVFIVYISIYTSAHPEKYQALLKYMHIVRPQE
jgi:orotate phosphoribosyltransferase-like protein